MLVAACTYNYVEYIYDAVVVYVEVGTVGALVADMFMPVIAVKASFSFVSSA